MDKILTAWTNEPVRVYEVIAAVLALAAAYVDLPVPLILGVVAAVLGVAGERVRAQVTPVHRQGA